MHDFIKLYYIGAICYLFLSFYAWSDVKLDILTYDNVNASKLHYQKRHNNDTPFIGSARDLELPDGNIVEDWAIRLFAERLKEQKKLPKIESLSVMLDSKFEAERIFCWECLRLIFGRKPEFNPLFPPGSEPEKINQIRAEIKKSIKVSPPSQNQ